MLKKYKNGFIPAALVCLGVEHAPGSLPCSEGVNKNQDCNLYEINFVKETPNKHLTSNSSNSFITKNIAHAKERNLNSLYNRLYKRFKKDLSQKEYITKINYEKHSVLKRGKKYKHKKFALNVESKSENNKVIVKAKDKNIKATAKKVYKKPQIKKVEAPSNTYT
ncbi:MAG: hypothetical protein GXN91_01015, partial [Epsilonproteobacteria bacterium]|nr:hypothetical protein [Campylobacterota bacterium]